MDTRPVAIVCYPKYDHNGAFSVPSWEPLREKYNVRYYEVGSDEELRIALEDGTKDGLCSVVWIGAHGSPELMQLGNSFGDSRDTFDLSDAAKMKDAFTRIIPGAMIVLDSCSTGAGRDQRDNLANMVKRLAPMAEVYAAETTTDSSTRAVLNANGKLVGPGFSVPDAEVYRIAPEYPTPGTAAWYAALATVNLQVLRTYWR